MFRKNKVALADVSPQILANIIVKTCLSQHQEFISATNEEYTQEAYCSIFAEILKSRTAQLCLAYNTINPAASQSFFPRLLEAMTEFSERPSFAESPNFPSLSRGWCDDVEASYLLYDFDDKFFQWADRHVKLFGLKLFNEENNIIGKPTYILTYKMLRAAKLDTDDLFSLTPIYSCASLVVLETHEIANRLMSLK